MSFLFPGGPLPLFDKLGQHIAQHGHEADGNQAGQGLSANGVEASVNQELKRLLNSRSSVRLSDFAEARLTVLDYGIPDYTALSAQNDTECTMIADAIRHAIACFEPRLSDVIVTPLSGANGRTIALFCIEANLQIAQTVRRVRFTLVAGDGVSDASASLPSPQAEPEVA